jgi:proteasome accessory factor C
VRLLPIEAHALLAAIDLIGAHHYPGLESAQHKVEAALGEDAVRDRLLVTHATGDDPDLARVFNRAIADCRVLRMEYYSTTDEQFSERRIEPYALFNGNEAWYVAAVDPVKEELRHFRLDRVKTVTLLEETFERDPDLNPIADIEGWPRTGEIEDSRTAHVWISPAQARWAREERTVLSELEDGAVIVSWTYKGRSFLVKDVLKEAGDAVILHPEDAREAVRAAAERLLAPVR